jgi:aminoglycoside 6'-N-acetyltransferase I
MRTSLWPDEAESLPGDLERFFAGERVMMAEALLAIDDDAGPVGFAELSIRSHVDGCETNHVGYLEGWFVEPEFRRRGVGAMLIKAAENWARQQGCTEFGSDTWLDNEASIAAHTALGFIETDRVVSFMKPLN